MDPLTETQKAATNRFNHAVGRSLKVWRLIWSLQTYMQHGSSAAERGILQAVHEAGLGIIARPDYGTHEQRQAAEDMLPVKAAAAASNTIADARTAATAASIVFAHSLLDAAIDEYCAVSAMLCPNNWQEFVDENTITLGQARAAQFHERVEKAVSLHLKKVRHKSIVNKIKTLQQICKSGSDEILKNYAFDADRIERFDSRRHDIVHGGAFDLVEQDLAADLEFIERTSVYLSALITHRYGLLVGPEAMTEAIK